LSTETTSEAEEARRAHSIVSGIRGAVLVWYALLGSIGAWTIHLVLFAAYVRFSCNAPGSSWVMHVATVVTLAMTVLAMWLCRRMMRSEGDESSDEEGGRAQFIARMGLMIGVLNFALIALEEIYLIVLNSRRCG
jgi:membrane protein implicated in regulation of membrane protease activity